MCVFPFCKIVKVEDENDFFLKQRMTESKFSTLKQTSTKKQRRLSTKNLNKYLHYTYSLQINNNWDNKVEEWKYTALI